MLLSLNNIENILIKLLIVSVFIDAYSLFSINSFYVTAFTIILGTIIVFYCVKLYIDRNLYITTNSQKIALIFIIYLFLNYILTGAINTTSLLLSEFYFISFFLSVRIREEKYFKENIKIFQILVNVTAIYGIYQFLGRLYDFPFSDLYIDGYMVLGYNWTNAIYSFPVVFQRSNAIFREPSFFSQMIAINILLYAVRVFNERWKELYRTVLLILLNLCAMILTFSGTGPLILIVTIFIYGVSKCVNKRSCKYFIYGILGTIFLMSIFFNTSIGEYFLGRLSEIFDPNQRQMSGSVRFVAGLQLTSEAWESNFLLGTGIGNGRDLLRSSIYIIANNIDNGFYRICVELGLIGIFLWIGFLSTLIRGNMSDDRKILAYSLIPFMFCHEIFQSNYYWVFLFILSNSLSHKGEKNYKFNIV